MADSDRVSVVDTFLAAQIALTRAIEAGASGVTLRSEQRKRHAYSGDELTVPTGRWTVEVTP